MSTMFTRRRGRQHELPLEILALADNFIDTPWRDESNYTISSRSQTPFNEAGND